MKEDEQIPSLLFSPQTDSSAWKPVTASIIKQFHLDPSLHLGTGWIFCPFLSFIRCGLFTKCALTIRGRGSRAREAVTGLFASSLMDIKLHGECPIPVPGVAFFNPSGTGFCSLHSTLFITSVLVSLLWSLTSLKSSRSATLLSSVLTPLQSSRGPLCFEAMHKHLPVFPCNAHTKHMLCHCSAMVGPCHCCMCQPGFAPLGWFRLCSPSWWHHWPWTKSPFRQSPSLQPLQLKQCFPKNELPSTGARFWACPNHFSASSPPEQCKWEWWVRE